MNGGWLTAPLPAGEPAEIDTSVAHPARVYDYWLGGKDNFAADREAAATLDFAKPVALVLLGIMHLISDSEEPYRIVAALMDALPSGSYLALSHPAIDINPAQAEAQRRYNERVSTPQTLRTRGEVARFFDGLELVPPGLSYVHAWRPDPDELAPSSTVSAHGGVARKP